MAMPGDARLEIVRIRHSARVVSVAAMFSQRMHGYFLSQRARFVRAVAESEAVHLPDRTTESKSLQGVMLPVAQRISTLWAAHYAELLGGIKSYSIAVEPLWLFDRSQRLAVSSDRITGTTYSRAEAVLEEAAVGGHDNPWLREAMAAIFHDGLRGGKRNRVIAFTEANGWANLGAATGVRQVGVGFITRKCWLSHQGARKSHADADLEKQNVEQPFMATGEPLRYPVDINGRPENSIMCRCLAAYATRSNPDVFV